MELQGAEPSPQEVEREEMVRPPDSFKARPKRVEGRNGFGARLRRAQGTRAVEQRPARGRTELNMQRTGLESPFCPLIAGFPRANSSLLSCLSFLPWATGLKFHVTEELYGLYEIHAECRLHARLGDLTILLVHLRHC